MIEDALIILCIVVGAGLVTAIALLAASYIKQWLAKWGTTLLIVGGVTWLVVSFIKDMQKWEPESENPITHIKN